MPVECETITGSDQFTGVAGAGLFDFDQYTRIPRTTRVVLTSIAYTELRQGDDLTTNVTVHAVRPGGLPTERMILGRGLASETLLDPITGNAELRLCGIVLPREPGDNGQFWQIEVVTVDKTETGSACVDHILSPYPDT